MEVEITRELPPLQLAPIGFDNIQDRLRDSYVQKIVSRNRKIHVVFIFSLKSIAQSHEKHAIEYEKINQAYEASQISLEKNTIDHPKMEKAYQFYQQCRAYLYSFTECYNEKVISQ
jgi:hypothetical protein